MKVYKDLFTKDELMSDSYKLEVALADEELADIAFEVKSRRVQKGAEDFGIAENLDEDAEAGSGGGGGGDAAEMVNDVMDAFHYTQVSMNKKEFGAYIKGYMGRVKTHLEEKKPERVEPFMKGATVLVKKILSSFDDYDFYMTETMDMEAYLVPSYYKGEEEAPRFIFLKDGCIEAKF
eukprot:Selendium_serpulae@DN502_c0_g1_i1.p1